MREDKNSPLECAPEIRLEVLDRAREEGYLFRLGRALQQASPGESPPPGHSYMSYGSSFRSPSHAMRDVFLALEAEDNSEFLRLIRLCESNEYLDPGAVLCSLYVWPLQPERLRRLPEKILYVTLVTGLLAALRDLELDDSLFRYVAGLPAEAPEAITVEDYSHLSILLAQGHLLRGEVSEARRLLRANASTDEVGMCGALELLAGDPAKARTAFAAAAKRTGRYKADKVAYLSTMPAVLHVLMLVQSDEPADRKQAETWLRWAQQGWLHPYRYSYQVLETLWHHRQGRSSPLRGFGGEGAFPLSDMMQWLLLLLAIEAMDLMAPGGSEAKHPKLHEDLLPSLERYARQLADDGAAWPAMQMASLLERLGRPVEGLAERPGAFFARTGMRGLATLWPRQQGWELQLSALEAALGGGGAPAGDRRLGWKLREGWNDSIQVAPVEQKRTKRGRWSKGRQISLRRLITESPGSLDYATEQDRAALAHVQTRRHGYYHFSYELPGEEVLAELAGHPNVFWEGAHSAPVEVFLADPELQIRPDGEYYRVTMEPSPQDKEDACRLIPESASRIKVVRFSKTHRALAEAFGNAGLYVPKEHWDGASARLAGLTEHVAVRSAEADVTFGEVETVDPDPAPHVRLQRLGAGVQAEMVVLPLGAGSAAFPPGGGSVRLIENVDGKAVQAQRCFAREREQARLAVGAVPVLAEVGPGDHWRWTLGEPAEALELLEQLQALPAGVLTVEWLKGDPIRVSRVSADAMHVSVRSVRDWFEVDGSVTVRDDLVVRMRQLLEAVRRDGSRFVKVGDGEYLALTEQIRRQLRRIADLGDPASKAGGLRVHPLAALGLADEDGDGLPLDTDDAFDAHVERFRQLASYQPEVPSTLQAELREYQQEGFAWLARLARWGVGACLADDMGLGKTVQALAAILLRAGEGPTLVVAPTSVCANWVSEARRFAPTLRPIRLGANDKDARRAVVDGLGPFDLLICSYTMLHQHAEALQSAHFTTVVLDEAQAIKNAHTKRSAAAMALRGDFRMVCTGTPIENRLDELWNLFRFLNPGLLGSRERFRQRFVLPIERDRGGHARSALRSLIRPFVLRRTKSQVLEELPARTETTLRVELSEEEHALHESIRQQALERLEDMGGQGEGQRRMHLFAELMKLRRCCCHPRLVLPDSGLAGSKLQVFGELVDHLLANRHKALVFSQFTGHLALLRDHLNERGVAYQYLDGSTPAAARQKRIDAFQNGRGELFLISLRAGGTGLNLTAADYVIHMDPWWNPAVENQATDRAHRIGQTRPVTVYRLVAADTIEEKIVALHHRKRELSESLLAGTDAAPALSLEQLLDLLR